MTAQSGEEGPKLSTQSRQLTPEELRTAMWCHLSSLAGVVLPLPGANVFGPLGCWLSRKDKSRFVNFHGKESLNFQINMLFYGLICAANISQPVWFSLYPSPH